MYAFLPFINWGAAAIELPGAWVHGESIDCGETVQGLAIALSAYGMANAVGHWLPGGPTLLVTELAGQCCWPLNWLANAFGH